jgi:tetratricopeptide (TPR) repeat protein
VEQLWGRPVEYASDSMRLGGPFGSAAYAGAACCLLVPLSIGAALDRRLPNAWRLVGAAATVGLAVTLVGSGARAAWVGLAVALVLLAVVLRGRAAAVVVATGLVLAAVGIGFTAADLPAVTERPAGATSRVDEWRVAWRVLQSHPVAGVGPEGYRLAFADGVDASYERRYGREVQPDRAHSGPIDVALAMGVPGGLTYVGLLALAAVAAVRSVRRRRVPGIALAGAVLAYQVQQLLLFPLAELDPIFWLLAGALLADTSVLVDRVTLPRPARLVATGLGGLLVVVAAVAAVADVAADRAARVAVERLGTPEAVESAERAAKLRPDVVRYHLLLASASQALGTRRGVDQALEAVGSAQAWSPRDPVVVRRQAELLTRRARITGSPPDLDAAIDAWAALVAADPVCRLCQLGYGDATADAGDATSAERAWRAADELTDRDPSAAERLRDLYTLQGRAGDAAVMAKRVASLDGRRP